MKVLGIIGSPRKDGQTSRLIHRVVQELRAMDSSVEAEFVYTADLVVSPCRVLCSEFCSSHPYRCSIDDDVPPVFRRMAEADVVLLGAPCYFRGPPAAFHTMAERMVSMCFFPQTRGELIPASPLAGTLCGLVAVAEYSNPQGVLEYLNDLCHLLGMSPASIPGFPYLGVGGHGDIAEDDVFHPFERARELADVLLNH